MRVLRLQRPNMTGGDVKYLQRNLADLGLDVPVDGVYNSRTMSMVIFLQSLFNLPMTGSVDETTWALVNNGPKNPLFWSSNTQPALARFLAVLRSLINVPYIHGSSDPLVGLDSIGFLLYACSAAWGTTAQDLTVTELFEACRKEGELGKPHDVGDVLFYAHDDVSLPQHCMVQLNQIQCIGAVGGNRATSNLEMANKRDARVKIRPFNYRKVLLGAHPVGRVLTVIRGRTAPQSVVDRKGAARP